MQFIRQSLGIKVILLSSLLTIVAFTGLFIYNSYSTYHNTLEDVHQASEQVASYNFV